MSLVTQIFLAALIFSWCGGSGQTVAFREKLHWGIKENEQVILQPVFDTILNFDETGSVCMACFKIKGGASKIIKTNTFTFACNYFNKKHEKLRIRAEHNDTCSVFSLGKNSLKQYTENPSCFVVSVKNKKYLVGKDFRQLTFNGYHDVAPSLDPGFYITQVVDENETVFSGLVNREEKEIVPHKYSHIRINPVDSLIMCCSAGVRENSDDDIFDFSGKKVASYHRHVEMITRNYVIHKVFEPKEHFVIYNIKSKEDKPLQAHEVHFFDHDEILIRIKDDWYVYNLNTNQKKQKQF